ncbi:MAG: GIY-YIG nuclease family protein [Acidobacteria bacterium]|nr:GIY-YIG nuclease family protein [Acidobacteriota bacterium]MBI3661619.1 GIY-YIG nuclease family protein [Acidobacteriota bacterium]
MTKDHILREIRRTAEANGGVPLGWRKFFSETGIKERDWLGKHWARWSEAIREAGYAPNQLTAAYSETALLEKFIELARELGQIPVKGDLLVRARRDTEFPNPKTFEKFGSKAALIDRVCEYCRTHTGYDDVLTFCAGYTPRNKNTVEQTERGDEVFGFVYLTKFGHFFKIGKTNAPGRRERELAIQLPEKSKTVHVIRTDDPTGIEAYWHKRFEEKRKNGEWFELDSKDVAAFRRRKFM